jgi:hypothetical protein
MGSCIPARWLQRCRTRQAVQYLPAAARAGCCAPWRQQLQLQSVAADSKPDLSGISMLVEKQQAVMQSALAGFNQAKHAPPDIESALL